MGLFDAVKAIWRSWRLAERDGEPIDPDPIDHPALRAMSLREIGDLPLDPPQGRTSSGIGRGTDPQLADGAREMRSAIGAGCRHPHR